MKLKIRNGVGNNDYRIIDKIKEIAYEIGKKKETNKVDTYELSSREAISRNFILDEKNMYYIRFDLTMEDKTGMILYTDQKSYILDEKTGSTTEIIYASSVCGFMEDYIKSLKLRHEEESKCECITSKPGTITTTTDEEDNIKKEVKHD